MFTNKSFTITIGNDCTLLALHQGSEVKSKLLIETLNDETSSQILDLFKKNRSVPIYILLDNSEQTYTNKTYPFVSRSDLKQLIDRYAKQEFESNKESETIYNYIVTPNKKAGKWECLFISSTYFEEMKKWLGFVLHEITNPLHGIYMLPVETINLVKKINAFRNSQNKEKKSRLERSKITLLIMQNKVSGVRQIVFYDDKIVFTRLVNYNLENPNFISDYEQDIFRTNEYLRRIIPNMRNEDVEVINVLPRVILEKISQIKNADINFVNYTPREVSVNIGYGKTMPKGSQFSDAVIANVFVNSKKILKTTTSKIKKLSIFSFLSRVLYAVNAILFLATLSYFIFIQIEQDSHQKEIQRLNDEKIVTEQRLIKLKKEVVGAKGDKNNIAIDEIIEYGIFDEMMEVNQAKALDVFENIDFIKGKNAKLKAFSFSTDYVIGNQVEKFEFNISGDISNESGNVENLFKIYDGLILQASEKFKGYNIKSSELPKDIDFSKEYRSVPFKLTIKK